MNSCVLVEADQIRTTPCKFQCPWWLTRESYKYAILKGKWFNTSTPWAALNLYRQSRRLPYKIAWRSSPQGCAKKEVKETCYFKKKKNESILTAIIFCLTVIETAADGVRRYCHWCSKTYLHLTGGVIPCGRLTVWLLYMIPMHLPVTKRFIKNLAKQTRMIEKKSPWKFPGTFCFVLLYISALICYFMFLFRS